MNSDSSSGDSDSDFKENDGSESSSEVSDHDSSSSSDGYDKKSGSDWDENEREKPPKQPRKQRTQEVRGPAPVSYDPSEPGTGYLAYVFVGDQSQAEIAVLRNICMKYGLQAWDEMVSYMPWRNRAAFRTTLCHIIRKQALSEYEGIRADPFKIQGDNPLAVDGNYDVKGGMLINTNWERTSEELDQLREQNAQKYEISQEESDSIDIPIIMSVEYMKQQCFNRKQSLLLKRAALRQEAMKRGLAEYDNLGVGELVIDHSGVLDLPEPGEALKLLDPDGGIYPLDA